jgi:hypothetical protein
MYQRPTLKLSEWSPVEDALVCRLQDSLGSKWWATIAQLLPGRTDNGINNSNMTWTECTVGGANTIEADKDCHGSRPLYAIPRMRCSQQAGH